MAPKQNNDRATPSGLRPAPIPPNDSEPLDVSLHYLAHYVSEVGRARGVVKRRAKGVVVWGAALTGTSAILGGLVALTGSAYFGLAGTATAAALGVVSAWDGHFQHRELWVQRSGVLAKLQKLERNTQLLAAESADREALARTVMEQLDGILEEDLDSWTSLRDA